MIAIVQQNLSKHLKFLQQKPSAKPVSPQAKTTESTFSKQYITKAVWYFWYTKRYWLPNVLQGSYKLQHKAREDNSIDRKQFHRLKRPRHDSNCTAKSQFHFKPTDFILETSCGTETLVKRLKKEAVLSVFPWTNTFASPSILRELHAKQEGKNIKVVLTLIVTLALKKIALNGIEHKLPKIQLPTRIHKHKHGQHCTETLVKRLKKEAVLSVFPWTNTFASPSILRELHAKQEGKNIKVVLTLIVTLALKKIALNGIEHKLPKIQLPTRIHKHKHGQHCVLKKFEDDPSVEGNKYMARKRFGQIFSPYIFKRQLPTTRIIIDGTEYPIRKPRLPFAQQSTFSTYKNRNTIKISVGETPGGLVSYVSPSYGGSTSDRFKNAAV
ncbi:unnamed protein product [Mytilus coruscus]|uniref:DDE Tnp4 domain-containing protein n=1 Tax=Mytilus coruscus TaxID=42192 RepID=A0A6J8EP13_MYTCO|nr:unnamed protein product [Mytilus coruscus]